MIYIKVLNKKGDFGEMRKKVLPMLLALFMFVALLPVTVHAPVSYTHLVPEVIDGMPVTKVSAYAFSARKDREEKDIFLCESEEAVLFGQEEHLLAGWEIEEVRLPNT